MNNKKLFQGALLPSLHPTTSSTEDTTREQNLQDELDADGIVVAKATESLICPITQTRLEHPMVNSKCGHSYERSAINEHMRRSKSLTVKCPVGGCPGTVNQAHLKLNKRIAELLLSQNND